MFEGPSEKEGVFIRFCHSYDKCHCVQVLSVCWCLVRGSKLTLQHYHNSRRPRPIAIISVACWPALLVCIEDWCGLRQGGGHGVVVSECATLSSGSHVPQLKLASGCQGDIAPVNGVRACGHEKKMISVSCGEDWQV